MLHASGFPRSKRVVIGVTGGRSWSLTTSRSGTFEAGITLPIREGWWSVVSQSGRSRAINRFHVTSHGPGGQVIDVASTRGQRLRITPAGLFPGGTVQLRGAAFGRSHTLTVAGFAVTRTVKASRTGSFSAKIVVPATTAPGPSKVVVSGGGPRFSVTLHVFRSAAPAGGGAVPPVFTTPTLPNALWHMDDSGTVMVDSAGHHDGILHNIETGRPGSIGSAFGFNGSTSYAWVAPAADLSAGAADVTLSIRMRTSKLPPVSADDWDLIGSGDSFTDGNEYKVEYYPNGTVECGFVGSAGHKEVFSDPAKPLNDGAWHTIQCVKTATDVKTIIDGTVYAKSAQVGTIVIKKGIIIGAHPNSSGTAGSSDWYDGALDEASIQVG